MSRLYSSPLRVYLFLGALAFLGIFSGWNLPVSLFPNSAKPTIVFSLPYGNLTPEEFLSSYGKRLEEVIRAISTDKIELDRIEANYGTGRVQYDVHFKWGVQPTLALKEVQTAVNSFVGRLPEESRDGLWLWLDNENSGFFALSFFSATRDLDELYDYLEPILAPRLSRIRDAQNPGLWNPSAKEISIELIPGSLAALQLFPRDVDDAVLTAIGGRAGGQITVGTSLMQIQMPRQVASMDELRRIPILTPAGKSVHLGEIARIGLQLKTTDSHSFKTSGAPSLILWATPKPGGNVKRMSEEVLEAVKDAAKSFPPDVKYRVLVDPSEFIRSAVNNVLHEVGIAALLAVFVLFVFIGSVRNVITAAIEIPMSMVLAFILMRLSGMNLNLISLGGLALSAGMNVDASVVVMENIFRHFEMQPGPHDFPARVRIVTEAVKEVGFAVIASTIASLVVFLPLTFTSDLSYAILGDLALAVVFSHGFSALVALLLVPTVRLHLMKSGKDAGHAHSPIEKQLKWLDETYARLLGGFIARPRLKWLTYGGLACLLGLLAVLVLPRLPREIVGTPDTDWMILSVNTQGNTLLRQMEIQAESIERDVLREFGEKVAYTFNNIRSPNSGTVMVRLKNKSDMRPVWKAMEKRFTNTPMLRFWVGPWNPSELPIPDPPDLRIAVRGGSLRDRMWTAKELSDVLQEKYVFPRIYSKPSSEPTRTVTIAPYLEQWSLLRDKGSRFYPGDLADLARVATTGRHVGWFPIKDRQTEIVMRLPQGLLTTVEEIGALPVGIGPKIVPLKALASIRNNEATPNIYREDERELFLVEGRQHEGDGNKNAAPMLANAKKLVAEWEKTRKKGTAAEPMPSISFEPADKDLTEAIHQLGLAVGLSILLILLTLIFQFGSLVEPVLVLVSIPLGFIGVLVSLFVFGSKLSLNSILGVILLNGISVANSIILVDFIKRLVDQGLEPRLAAVEAARKRLRPILITSLTTVLGMFPVALGLGEGGRILQPLGIAVSGGLWVSMALTLFLVPALQVSWLEARSREREPGRFGRLLRSWSLRGLFESWRPSSSSTLAPVVLLALAAATAAGTVRAAQPPTPASPAPFLTALNRIVDRHPFVARERARLDAVKGRNLPAHLSLLPSLTANAKQTYGESVGLSSSRRGLEIAAELNIFRFGADVAAMRAASAEEEAQAFTVQENVLKAEEEGVKALVGVIQSTQERDIQQKILDVYQDYLGVAEERFRKGLLASQEVDKIKVDVGNAQAAVRDSETELAKVAADLRALLGDDKIEMSWPWTKLIDRSPKILSETEPDLSHRPDWSAAQKRVTAATYRADQSWGKVFPSLDLNVTYGWYNTRPQANIPPPYSGPELAAGITLTIPLFDRLSNYGGYREAVGRTGVAEAELERTRRSARADWEAAKAAFQIALQTAKQREETLGVSRRIYEDGARRLRAGLAGANELSVDQERLGRSALLTARGWGAVHIDVQRVCHSIGRRVEECLNAL